MSLPLVSRSNSQGAQIPAKQSSSPAVVLTKSPIVSYFELLADKLFKVCGENYGSGEAGQAAIDAAWNTLSSYAEQHPQCRALLPNKPVNVKVNSEALRYIQWMRGDAAVIVKK